jgi:hypothetical protein
MHCALSSCSVTYRQILQEVSRMESIPSSSRRGDSIAELVGCWSANLQKSTDSSCCGWQTNVRIHFSSPDARHQVGTLYVQTTEPSSTKYGFTLDGRHMACHQINNNNDAHQRIVLWDSLFDLAYLDSKLIQSSTLV